MHFKNILKIFLVLLILAVCIGSVYAADDGNDSLTESHDDDFELDEELDDFDDEGGDDLDDEDADEGDDDLGDEDDGELDDDIDVNESDYNYSDFEYLKFKITYYLDSYGNCSSYNWTESEEFLNEYQTYLINPSNYTLNESSEGYQTYLKIFDSITSTFKDYNLTENETGYLKFMVIFYLNNYGNVSANYTWNESESFANYTPPWYLLGDVLKAMAMGKASAITYYFKLNNFKYPSLNNITDTNSTSIVNATAIDSMVHNEESWWNYIIIIVLVVIMLALVLI